MLSVTVQPLSVVNFKMIIYSTVSPILLIVGKILHHEKELQ